MRSNLSRLVCLLFALLIVASCDDDEKRRAEIERDQKKQEAVFTKINSAWNFNTHPMNPTSQTLSTNWAEWRVFLHELGQKPKSTIGAFRSKARNLSVKARDLNNNIPIQFDRPEIKSRLAVLATKVNSLNLYINLGEIPADKVITLISDINTELVSVQDQMGEISRRAEIPKEEGEADIIKMRDTARAIPNKPASFLPPAVEMARKKQKLH